MKLNKKKLFITILIISVIILSLFCYLINTNENYKDNLTMKDIENSIQEEINSSPQKTTEEIIEEPQEKCKTEGDLVNFCINYKSCCGTGSTTKECICSHPIVKNCRKQFDTCINDKEQIKIYGKKALMDKCIDENKACCIPYNSISINSDNFKTPIKNNPTIHKICSISSIPNVEEKCMELCSTNPECKAFSVNKGQLVQTYGTCNLYNAIKINQPKIDPLTGKEKETTNADYYIKK